MVVVFDRQIQRVVGAAVGAGAHFVARQVVARAAAGESFEILAGFVVGFSYRRRWQLRPTFSVA